MIFCQIWGKKLRSCHDSFSSQEIPASNIFLQKYFKQYALQSLQKWCTKWKVQVLCLLYSVPNKLRCLILFGRFCGNAFASWKWRRKNSHIGQYIACWNDSADHCSGWYMARLAPENRRHIRLTRNNDGTAFDFKDFEAGRRKELIQKYPDFAELITELTFEWSPCAKTFSGKMIEHWGVAKWLSFAKAMESLRRYLFC